MEGGHYDNCFKLYLLAEFGLLLYTNVFLYIQGTTIRKDIPLASKSRL